MRYKNISRRQLFGYIGITAISLLATNIEAGDFRYEPRAERSWPRNMIRAIQTQLNGLGFDSGQVDGLYGPNTRGAIIEFQQSKNLVVDGEISNKLIRDLNLER